MIGVGADDGIDFHLLHLIYVGYEAVVGQREAPYHHNALVDLSVCGGADHGRAGFQCLHLSVGRHRGYFGIARGPFHRPVDGLYGCDLCREGYPIAHTHVVGLSLGDLDNVDRLDGTADHLDGT